MIMKRTGWGIQEAGPTIVDQSGVTVGVDEDVVCVHVSAKRRRESQSDGGRTTIGRQVERGSRQRRVKRA
jgi:hypothetical protein